MLKMEEVESGNNNKVFQDVLDDLSKNNISLNNIKTSSNNNSILWNSKTNQFLLEKNISKESNASSKYDFWKIQDSVDENQQYSIYASDSFNSTDTVSIGVGFDAGNQSIKQIKYIRNDSAQSVNIRTNGGTLVVRAPNDTVKHYGEADAVIVSRDTDSYLENGISHATIDPTFVYGNKFAQTDSSRLTTQTKRAALDVNLYLDEGITIKLIDDGFIYDACRTVRDNEPDLEHNQQTTNPLPRYPGEEDYMNFTTNDYVVKESTYHGIAFARANKDLVISNLDQLLFEDMFAITYHEPGSDSFNDEVIDGMNLLLRTYGTMFPNGVVVSTETNNYVTYHGYLKVFTGNVSSFNESTTLQNSYNKIKIYHDGGFAQLKPALDVLESHSDVYRYSSNANSVVFVGDSITFGSGTTKTYCEYLNEDLLINSYISIASVGSCVSDKSSYGDDRNPLIDNYQAIPKANVIMVYLGTNDYGRETPLGTSSDTTDDTFYGSLDIIMNNLKTRCSGSKIIFLTPTRRYKDYTSSVNTDHHFVSYTEPNGRGYTLGNYVDAIKEMCTKYSFDVIDLFTLWDIDPSSSSVRSSYMPDGLHPNASGHRKIEDIIYNQLPTLGVDYRTTAAKEMQYGNKFAESGPNRTSPTRISLRVNRYLKAGTTITLNNSSTYEMGIASTYDADSSTLISWANGGWKKTPFTITSDGWYGFAFGKGGTIQFNLRTENVSLDDLVTIVEP